MTSKKVLLAFSCLALSACSSTQCRPEIGHYAHQFFNPERNWNCGEMRTMEADRTVYKQQAVVTQTTTTQPRLLPVIHSYTLYFDLNKSNIRADDDKTLAQISDEIEKYNPTQVTVAGHTDTSGSRSYNQRLSERRANMVSAALTKRGVSNQVINEEALGETDLAVQTPDGVKNQENRRVVVDFRK